MYEARQNKEKVSRRIDGGDGARQRMKIDSHKKNPFMVGNVTVQHPIIQAVNGGVFRDFIDEKDGYITLVVDSKNLGHTYIVIETKEGNWMYHFKANATNGLTKFIKLFAWEGTFEKIERRYGHGKNPRDFIANRPMDFSELKVSKEKADTIKSLCENTIGSGFFSLVLSNIRIGNNCFSKVYNILKEAGFQLTWSSYLLSFISPRLALSLGHGFYNVDDKTTTSTYSYWRQLV